MVKFSKIFAKKWNFCDIFWLQDRKSIQKSKIFKIEIENFWNLKSVVPCLLNVASFGIVDIFCKLQSCGTDSLSERCVVCSTIANTYDLSVKWAVMKELFLQIKKLIPCQTYYYKAEQQQIFARVFLILILSTPRPLKAQSLVSLSDF